MYDLLIVGAGLTAATLVARLRGRLRICVVETRPHLAGNCYDEPADGSHIHRYGPHIFHSPSPRIVEFLANFTQWMPYTHRVTAEIEDNGVLRHVPFPYCRQTVNQLGRELNEAEIIDAFFRGYSQKMWGRPWEFLPASIRTRVPKDTTDDPLYYRDHFVAMPRFGYTRMIENMLDGAEILLDAPPLAWIHIAASAIVYTGRPDLIPVPGDHVTIAEHENLHLEHRSLDIGFADEDWDGNAACLHACSLRRPWTRKTHFGRLTGGRTPLVSTETPRIAALDEMTPFYPVETRSNGERFAKLSSRIRELYPALRLAGRLGTYRYFDMYQTVGQALVLADRLLAAHRSSAGRMPLNHHPLPTSSSGILRGCGR